MPFRTIRELQMAKNVRSIMNGVAYTQKICNGRWTLVSTEEACALQTVVGILNSFFFFFLICIVEGGVQTGSTRHFGHLLAYCTCPGW
jgi:hypothetical protein